MNRPTAISFAFLIGISNAAFANNNYFLPGDAFFHTEVTEDKLNILPDEKSPAFVYSRNTSGARGCGYAGYLNLQFPEMPGNLKKNLTLACKEVFSSRAGEPRSEENKSTEKSEASDDSPLNPSVVNVMFYNSSFDLSRFHIGLRYNENWVDEVVRFGHDADHVVLDEFISDDGALVAEWRDSKKVDPLQVTCPKLPSPLPDEALGSACTEPVRVSKDICAIVLETDDMSQYYWGSDKWRFYVVTASGVSRYHWVNQKWVVDSSFSGNQDEKQ